MTGFSGIDMTEVTKLANDLGRVPGRVGREAEQITRKGAQNVKEAMQAEAKSSGHYKHFAGAISYDRAMRLGDISYEIGPDKGRRQGALGNILYFGTSKNGPVLDIETGLRAEAPNFEKHLADLAGSVLDG